MSVFDKMVAAVTPPESEEARREARANALAVAGGANDWLGIALQHHQQIESAFERVRAATDADARIAAHRELALLLNGHSLAEEVVLYPSLADAHEKAHATMSYTEHSATKLQMGLLETIPVMSQEYLDKLEHIRGAVAHHMYEEEKTRFMELRDKLPADQHRRLTARFVEEYERYAGEGHGLGSQLGSALGANGSTRRGSSSLGSPGYQS
jgi:hypothetical protein